MVADMIQKIVSASIYISSKVLVWTVSEVSISLDFEFKGIYKIKLNYLYMKVS